MKRLLALILVAVLMWAATPPAYAGGWSQVKIPQVIHNPGPLITYEYRVTAAQAVACDTSGIHTMYNAYPTGADTTYLFSAAENVTFQQGVARSICVRSCDVTGANDNGIKAVVCTIVGTNLRGESCTEGITLVADSATTVQGVLAYKSLTSIKIAKCDDSGARVSVGFGNLIGLPMTLPYDTSLVFRASGARALTWTITYDDDEVEKNTFYDSDNPPDSSVSYDLLFYVPYLAAPSGGIARW
jgi:hypothetical protein